MTNYKTDEKKEFSDHKIAYHKNGSSKDTIRYILLTTVITKVVELQKIIIDQLKDIKVDIFEITYNSIIGKNDVYKALVWS